LKKTKYIKIIDDKAWLRTNTEICKDMESCNTTQLLGGQVVIAVFDESIISRF